jgi:hypothetical protein
MASASMVDLGLCRQDEDPRPRQLPADLLGRGQPVRGMPRRHPDVDDRRVRGGLPLQLEEL